MQVIRNINEMGRVLKEACVTIGNFDGVHIGHRQLFTRVKALSKQRGGTSVVISFVPHPLEVLRPGTIKRISTVERKIELIEAAGIDLLLLLPFTSELASMGAEEFIRSILVERIQVKELVVGYDYAFGRGRSGDIDSLRIAGEQYGFSVHVVPPCLLYGEPVSSSRIRRLVAAGKIDRAGELLGRPWQLFGRVEHGQKRGGAELGFPTANLLFTGEELIPMHGVYVSRVELHGVSYGGVTNIGRNPTFPEMNLTAETYILDFQGDIYGEELVVSLLYCLRGEVRFASIDELRLQIGRDIEAAVRLLDEDGRADGD